MGKITIEFDREEDFFRFWERKNGKGMVGEAEKSALAKTLAEDLAETLAAAKAAVKRDKAEAASMEVSPAWPENSG